MDLKIIKLVGTKSPDTREDSVAAGWTPEKTWIWSLWYNAAHSHIVSSEEVKRCWDNLLNLSSDSVREVFDNPDTYFDDHDFIYLGKNNLASIRAEWEKKSDREHSN